MSRPIMGLLYHYCNWVSTRWQPSVNLYKNRKETAQKKKQDTKQYKKHRIHKTENKHQNKKANIKSNIKK